MIRALYTSASGMVSQQDNIDVISNNISNISTPGYKKVRSQFKDAMYTAIESRKRPQPVNLQVGNGVRVGGTSRSFRQGPLEETGNTLDMALQGPGFFKVQTSDGRIGYMRDGSFNISVENDAGRAVYRLTTGEGYYVIDEYTGRPVEFQPLYNDITGEVQNTQIDNITVSEDGTLWLKNAEDGMIRTGKIAVVDFVNPDGLEAIGSNIYTLDNQGAAGGEIQNTQAIIKQGFLERSNVELVDEMSQLIIAQRAYQLNSRVLQSADEMERLANNIRG